jgi:hypothetical protein
MFTKNELMLIEIILSNQSDKDYVIFDNETISVGDIKKKIESIEFPVSVTEHENNLEDRKAHLQKALATTAKINANSKPMSEAYEENLREYYNRIPTYECTTDSTDYLEGQIYAVTRTLDILGVKVEGINA